MIIYICVLNELKQNDLGKLKKEKNKLNKRKRKRKTKRNKLKHKRTSMKKLTKEGKKWVAAAVKDMKRRQESYNKQNKKL